MFFDFLIFIPTIILGIINLILWPLKALFDMTGMTTNLDIAFAWLFFPFKYFGYWIDLAALGNFIIGLSIFYSLWWTYQLLRMAWSLKSGHMEQPEIE